VLGGSAATIAADKVITKARKIAAHAMEAAEADIEFSGGRFCVEPRFKPGRVAATARRQLAPPPGAKPRGRCQLISTSQTWQPLGKFGISGEKLATS
jgi:aerobic carbon-monoxide dehydrogenase large subunit